jgi:hypothetical protein
VYLIKKVNIIRLYRA